MNDDQIKQMDKVLTDMAVNVSLAITYQDRARAELMNALQSLKDVLQGKESENRPG